MKKDYLTYGNFAAFAAVVVFNILATMGVLGGVTTRDVSYLYQSLLTPADYAFSIWAVIYALVAVLVFRQINRNDIRDRMGYLFIVSCALNLGWIFAWQFEKIGLSFALIFILLIDLIMLMAKFKEADTFSKMAVGMYTGWINVAMLANLGALFTRYNLTLFGLSSNVLAVAGLVFGLVWIGFFLFMYCNVYYALGAVWGYLGIAVNTDIYAVRAMAVIGILGFVVSTIFVLMRKKC